MKDLNSLNKYRVNFLGQKGDNKNGLFLIPLEGEIIFQILASNGFDWEHVSVVLRDKEGKQIPRCPTWEEMCLVKSLFFEKNEVVMELHPSEDEYINNHPYCLHLWRPLTMEIPTPPTELVGIKTKKKKLSLKFLKKTK